MLHVFCRLKAKNILQKDFYINTFKFKELSVTGCSKFSPAMPGPWQWCIMMGMQKKEKATCWPKLGFLFSFPPDPYLHVPFDCDEAFFYIFHIDGPATVVWPQDFQVPHLCLKVQTFQLEYYWQMKVLKLTGRHKIFPG